jgi:signal transduction histidine kinase
MSLDAYHQQLQDLSRGLVALDLFITLLMLGSSVYLTERALKPARIAFERQRQFAAGASHELRTPLALIRSLAELVADHRCAPAAEGQPSPTAAASLESQESVTSDAEEIIHEVDYMTRLVTDLLLLARDERDRRAMNWVIVDVRRVIQGVVDKIEPLAAARGITLRSDLAGAAEGKANGYVPALVEGDPDRLRELALILLENAVRYTPRGGSVLVTLDVSRGAVMRGERRGHVTLAVRDTGVGIAPEDQPHVFEPFYRATSSTLRRASTTEAGGAASAGSGLGLALAHWIVEAHRGEIRLTSQPGKGTTFTIELPLVATARPSHPLNRATPRVSQPS